MSLPVSKEAIVGEEIDKGATEARRVTRLIRLPEVQHRVGLGRSTIYRWMDDKSLDYVRDNRYHRPPPERGRQSNEGDANK